MKKLFITGGIIMSTLLISAQEKPSQTQFMVRGYGHAGGNSISDGTERESSFDGTLFAPIFLFKHSDRIMFEAELEFALENGEVEVGFEYADFNYIINDYMTFRAGKFLLPFGTFMERLHPAWMNRLSTKPLGFGHDGISPAAGIGAELRGAFQVGYSKINYSVYTTNGPTLKTGAIEPEEAGMLAFNNFEDNNNNKAIGGRLGILPFPNSSLELGGSAYMGMVGAKDDPLYEGVYAKLFAGDLSFVKQIPAIKGTIDVKAQYNISSIGDANYYDMDEGDTVATEYTFKNESNSLYGQLTYRPSMAGNEFLKNLEFIGRYSTIQTPEGSEWEQTATQISLGLNYWISWRSVLKFSYQMVESEGGHGGAGTTNTTGIYVHWALGF